VKVSAYVARRIKRTRKDFRRETFRCGGKGGQKQNKTETGVRITCLITGISCEGREHRTREANQKAAFERLVSRLIDHYRAEETAVASKNVVNKTVRTYNEKRNEVKCELTGVREDYATVLDGKLDKLIMARMRDYEQ
jgi:protein subunit release factor A